MRLFSALCLLSVLASGQDKPESRLRIWDRETLRRTADPFGNDTPMAVGSLQKPFVAKAWAASHPGQEPPRMACTSASGCWHRAGHGELGLAKALSVSCNTYFRRLAADTPMPVLRDVLAKEGFQGVPSSPDAAIGLPGETPVVIRPSRLLEAYARLVSEPWAEGEGLRQHVLAGLRSAAYSGTASALGQGGCWAKTGTVPSPDGNPLRTRGLLLVLDDAGHGTLAVLDPGTGREVAAALRRLPRQAWSGSSTTPEADARHVTVRLFDLLPARKWKVRNLGPSPIPARAGFLGPGGVLELVLGDWVGPGLLEVTAPDTGLIRRLEGCISVVGDADRTKHLSATLTPREYVCGVISAELPKADPDRRIALGAAILRFLAKGPRHPDADVCDSTHCAWFVGRGPRVVWATPSRAILQVPDGEGPLSAIDDSEWSAMVALSHAPGPSAWSSDCGGTPLSSHAVWGDGIREAYPCSRHTPATTHPWQRLWKSADLAKAFGGPVNRLEIQHPDGVWTLAITGPQGTKEYCFDEAHRRLARVLGWDALPSPADEIHPLPEGYRVQGVGQGHRVGLCLRD